MPTDFIELGATFFISLSASILAYIVLPQLAARSGLARRLFNTTRMHLPRWADRVFLALAVGFMLLFGSLAVLRYLTFHTGYLEVNTSWDLALFDQMTWNSLHGRLFENSFIDAQTYLGKTFTPILLAIVPLYGVWSSPIVLLVVQTLAIGIGAFPVYWFAREQLGVALALTVGLAYFLFPAADTVVLDEFHEIVLSPIFLAFATFFLLRRHDKGFLVCLGLALLVKEEIALITIAFGAYVFLFQRRRWFGLALALFGAIWAAALLQYVIPSFRGTVYGSTFYYFESGQLGGGSTRYAYLGKSLSEIILTVLTRPDVVLAHVLVPDKIDFVLQLLTPLAFVSLVGVDVALLLLPTFAYSLLSTYSLQYSARSFYFTPLLPFLFFAAIVGLRRILDWGGGRVVIKASLAVLLLTASASSYFFQASGPLAAYFEPERYNLDAHELLGEKLMSEIPPDATVVAQNELLAHLSDRQRIYEVPIPDYRQVDYLVADTTRGWYDVHRGIWEDRLASGFFEIVTQQDGYIIAKRRAPAQRVTLHFGDVTLRGYTIVYGNGKPWGKILRPILEWQVDQPVMERYSIAVRVWDLQGHLWSEEDREPQDGALPTTQWQPGKPVGDQYNILLPPTMPPGEYQITVRVRDARTGDAVGDEQVISRITLEKNKSSFTASDLRAQLLLEQPYYVDMGELRLIGYKPISKEVAAGQALSVGVYWRAREKPRADYAVVVQLRDASGRVAFEQSARPANGAYPTTQWDAGEVLLDWHDLNLPNDLANGIYQIAVVLRNPADGAKLGETLLSTISVVN